MTIAPHPDNKFVIRSFNRFIAGMKDYLTINLGWSADEAATYLREPDAFKADWASGKTPSEAVDDDLSYGDM